MVLSGTKGILFINTARDARKCVILPQDEAQNAVLVAVPVSRFNVGQFIYSDEKIHVSDWRKC